MMNQTAPALLDLVSARAGHFRLESGYHSGLWFDLDPLFVEHRRTAPFVATLTNALRGYSPSAVCGPLLGGAFLAQLVAQALDVDFLFSERVAPSETTRMYGVRYRLPPALHTRVAGARIAIVDDVMSAGSALLGTLEELRAHGATVVAAGALVVLGSTGADVFSRSGVPVEAVVRQGYEVWLPAECPLCARGVPVESM